MGNASEIYIDRVVNYKAEYSAVIRGMKVSGDQAVGLCPFHQDRNDSFSMNFRTGQWHCFSEDIGGNFVDFWARIHNCDTKEAYKQILEKYGIAPEKPKADQGEEKKAKNISYSVSQYAFEKHLPEDWLQKECRIQTIRDRQGATYMKIPYMDQNGVEVTFRKRYAHKDFRWRYGSSGKIGLYGEWKLPEIRKAGYVVLVEGESDSQSLWMMGISALGVPGASMFKPRHAELLQDLKVYIHQEGDKGGETFLQKVTTGLKDGNFIGQVFRFGCGLIKGCKDPSDVYMKQGAEQARQTIMQLLKGAESIDLDAPEVIPEAIKGAPVNLRQPEGWQYSDKGIYHIDEKSYSPSLICRTPIILTQRLKSLETGEEKIEIAFKRDGEWKKAIFPRSTIFTARGITVLADLGCTITSENAKGVVSFLSALEAENIDIIQKADATSTFGWQPGKRFIPGREQGIVLDIDPSQKGMASAYCQQGTREGWIRTMEPHRRRDKFRFILSASFAAPLLRIINQRIFFVYNWGGSKGGKTAALKAALSAWGDPERLIVNFNATQVGLERTASFFCDLPLGIDERQLAGQNQEKLEQIVYMIASGTGKIRGSKNGGIQATRQWRTVAMATGEEPLSTETSQTGVSTRVLEIYGGPFDSEKEASMMHQQAPLNCGWAGPEFVEHLISLDEAKICEKYDEMGQYLTSIADGKSGSHVAGIAAVALADAMIETWFFESEEDEKTAETAENVQNDTQNGSFITEKAWGRAEQMAATILQGQLDADLGDVNENAVQFVTDWVLENRMYFGEKAIGACMGFMSETGNTAYIFPSALNQALTRAGFSPRKTLKYMADKDLIASSDRKDHKGKVYQVVRRFDNRLCRFVEFRIGKLSEADDPLEGPDEPIRPVEPAPAKPEAKPQEGEWQQASLPDQMAADGFYEPEGDEKLPFE